jgi:hypothetical protein
MVNSVEQIMMSAIDWPSIVHGTVNPGEYLEVNGTIYAVNWSDNCSWSETGGPFFLTPA